MTKITPARKTSKLCQGTDVECKELLETVPNFETLHTRKTSEEVGTILDAYLAGADNDADAESSSKETAKFGGAVVAASKSKVDQAFSELMDS